jgi:hypothetical protein
MPVYFPGQSIVSGRQDSGTVVSNVINQFSPDSIPSITAWYRSDDLAGVDGSSVSSWVDRTGNGRTVTQATGGKQPILKLSIINGRSVVRFDGVNDALTQASFSIVDPFAVFMVAQQRSAAGFVDRFYDFEDQQGSLFQSNSPGTVGTFYNGFGPSDVPASIGQFHSFVAVYSSTAGLINVDGVTTNGNTGSGSCMNFAMGGYDQNTSNYLPCDIAELAVYTTELTAGDISSLRNYAGSRYGI